MSSFGALLESGRNFWLGSGPSREIKINYRWAKLGGHLPQMPPTWTKRGGLRLLLNFRTAHFFIFQTVWFRDHPFLPRCYPPSSDCSAICAESECTHTSRWVSITFVQMIFWFKIMWFECLCYLHLGLVNCKIIVFLLFRKGFPIGRDVILILDSRFWTQKWFLVHRAKL